jgi:hypothetical protein
MGTARNSLGVLLRWLNSNQHLGRDFDFCSLLFYVGEPVIQGTRKPNRMAERVGFEALNVEPCTGLHGVVQAQETRHLSGFQFPLDLIDLF